MGSVGFFRSAGPPAGFKYDGGYVEIPIESFGYTGNITGGFPANSDRALCTRFTLTENANLTGMDFLIHSSATNAGNIKGFIAAVSAGEPTTILHVTAAQPTLVGGNLAVFTLTGFLTAGDYYVGAVSNTFDNNFGQTDPASWETRMANGTFSYATPPGTWPGTDVSYAVTIAARVYYQAA